MVREVLLVLVVLVMLMLLLGFAGCGQLGPHFPTKKVSVIFTPYGADHGHPGGWLPHSDFSP